jgi:UDP-N-acetylmuramate dehydrogenase
VPSKPGDNSDVTNALANLRTRVELSGLTSLALGGPAELFVEATTPGEVVDAARWAFAQKMPFRVMGGGSNLVVSDDGVGGLVLRMATRGVDLREEHDRVTLRIAAGESWDDVVACAVGSGLAGIECLSGIPGAAGATPIQNVGAYGVEVSDVLSSLVVLDRETLTTRRFARDECGFGYRTSVFRRNPDRYIVLTVELALRRGAPSELRYGELRRLLEARAAAPGAADVREAVLELRRSKGMVEDDKSPGSVGSFFVNPVVAPEVYERICAAAECRAPHYPAGDDGVKIPAAWLIEQAGFHKGMRRNGVGVSPRHSLALVHYGGSSTRRLLQLAAEIRSTVWGRFAVRLQPEPVFWGFATEDPLEGSCA